MTPILYAFVHEWKLFFKDRAAMLVLVVAGLFYAFYYPLPYLNEVARELPIGVVDASQTPLSRQLVRYADASPQVRVHRHYGDLLSAQKDMANGTLLGILQIPESFELDIRQGQSTQVGVYGHAGYFMVYSQIASGISYAAGTIGAGVEIKRLQAKGYSESVAMRIRDPLPMIDQSLYNRAGGYATYVVPAVMMLILQQTLLIGLAILGGARPHRHLPFQQGTPEQAQPLYARWLGRGFAYLAHYTLLLLFYHGVVYPFFNFPARGNFLTILVFAIFFLVAVIQLGFFIARFFKHRESAMQVLVYCSLPFLFASGFSWPLSAMPSAIRVLFWFVPSTHAVPAWIAIQQQSATLVEVAPHLVSLGVLALLYGILGYGIQAWSERSSLIQP